MTLVYSNVKMFQRTLLVLVGMLFTEIAVAQPKKIILDTDIGPDCDDAGAVAILHHFADTGEAELLGMMSCTSSEWGAPALDAINTYYGRPNIPIGTLKESGFLAYSAYSQYLAQNFPNDLKTAQNAPDATELYRKILAQQPDKSVVVVAIGPLKNLRKLLESQSDALSPLGGKDLVALKVKELVCMGGNYPGNNDGEWNFKQDGAAARYVNENWPTPIQFSGGELGGGISTGSRLFSETPENNPVRKAFELSPDVGDGGRPTWDETAVVYAIKGLSNYWTSNSNGYNEVGNDGVNHWHSTPNRGHSYLVKKIHNRDLGRIIDDFMVHSKYSTLPTTSPFDRSGWSATASVNNGEANKAVDNDEESTWNTGRPQQPGDWIVVDMKTTKTFNRVELDDYWVGGDYPRGYELYLSQDGNNWGTVVQSGRGSSVTSIVFKNQQARYLKLVQTASLSVALKNTKAAWSIRGIAVYLEPTSEPVPILSHSPTFRRGLNGVLGKNKSVLGRSIIRLTPSYQPR